MTRRRSILKERSMIAEENDTCGDIPNMLSQTHFRRVSFNSNMSVRPIARTGDTSDSLPADYEAPMPVADAEDHLAPTDGDDDRLDLLGERAGGTLLAKDPNNVTTNDSMLFGFANLKMTSSVSHSTLGLGTTSLSTSAVAAAADEDDSLLVIPRLTASQPIRTRDSLLDASLLQPDTTASTTRKQSHDFTKDSLIMDANKCNVTNNDTLLGGPRKPSSDSWCNSESAVDSVHDSLLDDNLSQQPTSKVSVLSPQEEISFLCDISAHANKGEERRVDKSFVADDVGSSNVLSREEIEARQTQDTLNQSVFNHSELLTDDEDDSLISTGRNSAKKGEDSMRKSFVEQFSSQCSTNESGSNSILDAPHGATESVREQPIAPTQASFLADNEKSIVEHQRSVINATKRLSSRTPRQSNARCSRATFTPITPLDLDVSRFHTEDCSLSPLTDMSSMHIEAEPIVPPPQIAQQNTNQQQRRSLRTRKSRSHTNDPRLPRDPDSGIHSQPVESSGQVSSLPQDAGCFSQPIDSKENQAPLAHSGTPWWASGGVRRPTTTTVIKVTASDHIQDNSGQKSPWKLKLKAGNKRKVGTPVNQNSSGKKKQAIKMMRLESANSQLSMQSGSRALKSLKFDSGQTGRKSVAQVHGPDNSTSNELPNLCSIVSRDFINRPMDSLKPFLAKYVVNMAFTCEVPQNILTVYEELGLPMDKVRFAEDQRKEKEKLEAKLAELKDRANTIYSRKFVLPGCDIETVVSYNSKHVQFLYGSKAKVTLHLNKCIVTGVEAEKLSECSPGDPVDIRIELCVNIMNSLKAQLSGTTVQRAAGLVIKYLCSCSITH